MGAEITERSCLPLECLWYTKISSKRLLPPLQPRYEVWERVDPASTHCIHSGTLHAAELPWVGPAFTPGAQSLGQAMTAFLLHPVRDRKLERCRNLSGRNTNISRTETWLLKMLREVMNIIEKKKRVLCQAITIQLCDIIYWHSIPTFKLLLKAGLFVCFSLYEVASTCFLKHSHLRSVLLWSYKSAVNQ